VGGLLVVFALQTLLGLAGRRRRSARAGKGA